MHSVIGMFFLIDQDRISNTKKVLTSCKQRNTSILLVYLWNRYCFKIWRDRSGRIRMVVGFTTTYAVRAFHHWCCEAYTVCDKVFQWLATGQWFSPGPPVSSTNKTDRHEITQILLKVALNTIKQTIKTWNTYLHVKLHKLRLLRKVSFTTNVVNNGWHWYWSIYLM